MQNPQPVHVTSKNLRSVAALLAIAFAIAVSLAPAPDSERSLVGAGAAHADCDTCGTAGHDPTGPGRP